MSNRHLVRAVAVAVMGNALPALAADIVLTPPVGGGVAVTNAAGTITRFRVGEEGVFTLPGISAVPVPATGLCVEIATGRVGTCSLGTLMSITAGTGLTGGTITTTGTIGLAATNLLPTTACAPNQIPKWNGTAWACAADASSGGTVIGVTASSPIASSGGTAPNISLAGTVPVANGGTGQTTLAANGIIYGNGANPVGTTVGSTGQVLVGTTSGAPAWTGSPSISGNLTLAPSTGNSSPGFIMKGTARFIHDFPPGSPEGNTFIGANAGSLGGFPGGLNGNTGLGSNTLSVNLGGNENTASGASALRENSSGSGNTGTGYSALRNNAHGTQNTAVGRGALENATGTGDIALGYSAGSNLTTGGGNIMIGNVGVAAEAATIRIGSAQTRAFIAGIRGITTGASDAVAVLIDSNGQLGTVSSSRRVKDNIADMDASSNALMKLRPVTFNYKADKNASRRALQYGLIAEEVADVYPELVAHSADGQVETVMYQYLPSMLLNEYQKQQRTIDAQARDAMRYKARLAELEQDRRVQAAEIAELKRQVTHMVRTLERLDPDARINTAIR
jgi:hypothetical protein